ncbi:HAD-IIIA family hydrolase [uncultured Abyssibacter sp.]|uniref:HAD-IIIA family hydrolase n=1 Tax=uncultured Abyssibacter sp. TaxID=2320202 RepID=UPI0032B2DEA8
MIQCAVLCGGLGTRLGALTAETPKPLLEVAGEPFLETLIFELGRQGIRKVLLLAAFRNDKITAFARTSPAAQRFGVEIEVAIEPDRAGTGGALWHAQDRLEDVFFLINGDTWFDIPVLSLYRRAHAEPDACEGVIALRKVDDASRYGTVDLDEAGRVTGFAEKSERRGESYINGGIYFLSKQALRLTAPQCSIEYDVLPALAAEGRLRGVPFDDNYFIDIGIPETYERAQTEIPAQKQRPAVFLDRDGVINEDHGHVGSVDRFTFIPGAPEAVAMLNAAGYYVFVVTNQAGIGRGYYSEADHLALMAHIEVELLKAGAHFDDHRYSPYHPEAGIGHYRQDHAWRKPRPGMLLDLMEHWRIDKSRSFIIGDKDSDIEAGRQAGIQGHLFTGGNLADFVRGLLDADGH